MPDLAAAVAMMTASFVLAAAGLGTGQLAAVQPITVLDLPMTMIGETWLLGSRLRRREWAAIAVMTAGVAVFLVSLDPRPRSQAPVAPVAWILGSVGSLRRYRRNSSA